MLLHSVGFQNAYRIEQSDYVGIISYEDGKVNITGKLFSNVIPAAEEDNPTVNQNQQRNKQNKLVKQYRDENNRNELVKADSRRDVLSGKISRDEQKKEELVERIDDELYGAEKYAELAKEHTFINNDLTELYEAHTYEELNYADELHTNWHIPTQ